MCGPDGCECRGCMGMDCDVLFAYATPKVVRIKDRRLGMLKYLFMVLIFVYVIIVNVWMKNGGMKFESPVGTLRFSLLQPLADPACDDPSCPTAIQSSTALPYCLQSSLPGAAQRRQCVFLDSSDAATIRETSIAIITRQDTAEETRSCPFNGTDCPFLYSNGDSYSTFVADIDSYTMLIDHTVAAPTLKVEGNARFLQGVIAVDTNSALCAATAGSSSPTAPCTIPLNNTANNLDLMTVGTIAQIVDTNMDKFRFQQNKTFRYDGFVILLSIEYTNSQHWKFNSVPISYTYRLTRLLDSNYKETYSVYRDFPNFRTYFNRHGILIAVQQTGKLGVFDITTLLMQLTTSMTLMAVATVLVDSLALYIMPEKQLYRDAKFQETEDFSDIRDARKHTLSMAHAPESLQASRASLLAHDSQQQDRSRVQLRPDNRGGVAVAPVKSFL